MKNKSAFSQILILVLVFVGCIVLTLVAAFLVGSYDLTIFDFKNFNFANVIPVLIIGGFFSCIVVGITVLFVSKSLFLKVKDFIFKSDDKGEDEK